MILICYGTRPEYLKVKPLMDEMDKQHVRYEQLFTSQHKDLVDYKAGGKLWQIQPHKLESFMGNRLDSILTTIMLPGFDGFEHCKYIMVQGDTTTAMSIALKAFHWNIPVIHLEAGLRTYDRKNPYPEEINRQIVSRIASIHFCPTHENANNLAAESITNNVHIVGNTSIDNLVKYKDSCEYGNQVLVTLHRRENHAQIKNYFEVLNRVAERYPDLEFIIPIHPNPEVSKHRDVLSDKIKVIDPLPHDDLLKLLVKCKFVITDSGGIQEECAYFGKISIVCRIVTERPEAIGATTFLCDSPEHLNTLIEDVNNYHVVPEMFKCPFGEGDASQQIVKTLIEEYGVR